MSVQPPVAADTTTSSGPDVLIVGGFLTPPIAYRRLAMRLRQRGARSVRIAPITAIDWLAAGIVGFGPVRARTRGAIKRAGAAAGGRPLLLVAHSGGGIVCRLALASRSAQTARTDLTDSVACLVTLGTPHGLATAPVPLRHRGVSACEALDRWSPGAFHAPGIGYVTVGSDAYGPSAPMRRAWDLLRAGPFQLVVGPMGEQGGDGIVGIDLAHLPGATRLTFHDVRHGTFGAPWYGDAGVVDRWWPIALDAWRGAIATRPSTGRDGPAGWDPGAR